MIEASNISPLFLSYPGKEESLTLYLMLSQLTLRTLHLNGGYPLQTTALYGFEDLDLKNPTEFGSREMVAGKIIHIKPCFKNCKAKSWP